MSNPLMKKLKLGSTTYDVCDPVARAAAGGGAGMSADVIQALLDCFQNVAWANGNGQTYYNALYDALTTEEPEPSAELSSISAVFTQGSNVVYSVDSLDYLKTMLTVTAHYSDSTTRTVTGYTLSGSLSSATSTITVSYGGKTTTFTVTVTTETGLVYSMHDHVFSGGAGSYVDTGYELLNADKDFTLFFDVETTGQNTAWMLFGYQVSGGTNQELYFVNNGNDATKSYLRWMENLTTNQITAFNTSSSGRFKFLCKHQQGTGSVDFIIKNGSGTTLYNQTITGTLTTDGNTHLTIGGNATTRTFKGTVSARIYERYFTPSDF